MLANGEMLTNSSECEAPQTSAVPSSPPGGATPVPPGGDSVVESDSTVDPQSAEAGVQEAGDR